MKHLKQYSIKIHFLIMRQKMKLRKKYTFSLREKRINLISKLEKCWKS